MPGAYMRELLYTMPPASENAMCAAGKIADQMPPAIPKCLTFIETVRGPPRRIFTDYPTDDEFERLEPAGVMEDCYGNMRMIYDCYH